MSTGLRDRFFAPSAGRASAEEAGQFRALVDATDTGPAATADGLAVCWHPSARFKAGASSMPSASTPACGSCHLFADVPLGLELAGALTAAVAAAVPPSLLEGFSHVNPVFRANRFEPGDARFARHRDTPYYDAARHHVSRYTMLVYLTGGPGEPALDLASGPALDKIEPFSCVIFGQRYEHEGAPYREGRKAFPRTELIFTGPGLTHDPGIGALSSKSAT